MKLVKIFIASLCVFIGTGVPCRGGSPQESNGNGAFAAPLVPPALRVLAARSEAKAEWPALARYAKSEPDHDVKGLAYFVLGYREHQAADDAAAVDDLERAASTGFSLADYAEYYRAAAAAQADEPEVAAHGLANFVGRFPRSALRDQATRLLASSLTEAGRPQEAIPILSAALAQRKQSQLELLLAQAYQKAGELPEAALAFQEIYYRLPTAPEAAAAGTSLKTLQLRLGTSYPGPSEELRSARASGLEKVSYFSSALTEYDALLRDLPASSSATSWRLGRDRCLLGLGRTNEALTDLAAGGWPAGELDAERTLLVVRANSHNRDESGMLAALDQMTRLYPASATTASALDSVSFFFRRQGDWSRASPYDAKLAEEFPDSDLAGKAEWEVAWAAYLGAQTGEAERRLAAYVQRYPSSARIAAALYWLGRVTEGEGRSAEARSLYQVLRDRFGNTYYSLQAAERLKLLGPAASPVARGAGNGSPNGETATAPPPLTAEVAAAISKMSTPPDPPSVCLAAQPGAGERPALTLAALSLPALAEYDLRARLEGAMGSPDEAGLRLALARLQREGEQYDQAILMAKRVVPNYSDYDLSALPAEFWGLLYPEAFWDVVRRNANANGLDPYLVMALIRQESGFDPKAASGKNAHGLMQLLPQTARDLTGGAGRPRHQVASRSLSDPAYNIRIGCRYLSDLIRKFDGSIEKALAAYNAGPDHVEQWQSGHTYSEPAAFVESIPFAETRGYVEVILRDQVVYRRLMTGKPKFKPCGGPGA
ncbi:MAG TPA: transglycosylase SLT domain-containing protein [Terriglobia bacterium]